MARLINNVEDLKRHIVLSANFDFKKVLPFAKRAERKIIINAIGREQYDAIVVHNFTEDDTSPINLVKELLEEAVANFAMVLALPTINLLITNSGTKTTENSESKNADWKEKRDLNRTLISTFTEALDDAFVIMEDNASNFDDWKSSRFYTVFMDMIVRHTSVFNDFFFIKNNRQTFMALKPYMKEVEDQYFKSMLGQCTLDFLKKESSNAIVVNAQELSRKAVVALTVAKVCDTGTFSFTETSMTIVYDELPWEKTKLELDADKLSRLQSSRQTAGEEYLKQLKKIIVQNPDIFLCYDDKVEEGISKKLIVKKSGLWL